MTEDEAKTKWCPMARQGDGTRVEGRNRCIGSECMMWRQQFVIDYKPHGYCGFGDKP